jgi:hypothetical protein
MPTTSADAQFALLMRRDSAPDREKLLIPTTGASRTLSFFIMYLLLCLSKRAAIKEFSKSA